MLADPYFRILGPKSTGFEYFNLDWLHSFEVDQRDKADVQATLCELTAKTIADHLIDSRLSLDDVFVCGGGAHNVNLMQRLANNLPEMRVQTTAVAGLDPNWVEATAFAWLAMRHRKKPAGQPAKCDGRQSTSNPGRVTLPLDMSIPYINRELSLLEFNKRVLAQASDADTPLLERLRFLCISLHQPRRNFLKIRVAGLKQRMEIGAAAQGPEKVPAEDIFKQLRGPA